MKLERTQYVRLLYARIALTLLTLVALTAFLA